MSLRCVAHQVVVTTDTAMNKMAGSTSFGMVENDQKKWTIQGGMINP